MFSQVLIKFSQVFRGKMVDLLRHFDGRFSESFSLSMVDLCFQSTSKTLQFHQDHQARVTVHQPINASFDSTSTITTTHESEGDVQTNRLSLNDSTAAAMSPDNKHQNSIIPKKAGEVPILRGFPPWFFPWFSQ